MAARPALPSLLAALRVPIRHPRIPSHFCAPPPIKSPARNTFPHPISIRAAHSIPRPPPPPPRAPQSSSTAPADSDARSGHPAADNESARPDTKGPAYYQLSFTCVPCGHRSHHNVSKQAYHRGSTLITCPGCRNRHVISDHLGIFGDRKITVEDLMREKGRLVKRGSLGEDGDIEFWPDEDPVPADQGAQGTGEGRQ